MTRQATTRLVVWVALLAAAVVGSTGRPAVAQQSVPDQIAADELTIPDLRINRQELSQLLRSRTVLLIDVRDRASYERAHLPGAVSIPIDLIESRADTLRSVHKPIITYCGGPAGEKGRRAALVLRQLGVSDVQTLAGGFQKWVADGYVVETSPTGV